MWYPLFLAGFVSARGIASWRGNLEDFKAQRIGLVPAVIALLVAATVLLPGLQAAEFDFENLSMALYGAVLPVSLAGNNSGSGTIYRQSLYELVGKIASARVHPPRSRHSSWRTSPMSFIRASSTHDRFTTEAHAGTRRAG